MQSPSILRMIRLPITQTHIRGARPDRPRHTLVPIYPRSRTPGQRITQPTITSIAIDRPLTRLIDQLDAKIKRNARRQPVRRVATVPAIRFAVKG